MKKKAPHAEYMKGDPKPDERSKCWRIKRPAKRICLMCLRGFDSEDISNRRCGRCAGYLEKTSISIRAEQWQQTRRRERED